MATKTFKRPFAVECFCSTNRYDAETDTYQPLPAKWMQWGGRFKTREAAEREIAKHSKRQEWDSTNVRIVEG